MNKNIYIGRLTADPQMGGKDTKVARFTLAVNRDFKNKEGEYTADFIPCATFGKIAELMEQYVSKGHQIAVEGRLENNNYTNDKGEMVYGLAVNVNQIQFLESRKETETPESKETPKEAPKAKAAPKAAKKEEVATEVTDSDLPF